jgi:hypothetical protein
MANAVTFSYDNAAIKEDLLPLITNLDFKEYQLGSGLTQTKASAVMHQWLNDSLKTPAVNAAVEGADASFTKRTAPTRSINYTQIISVPYEVSGTDQAADAAGYSTRLSYEMEKAMKEWKQDQEFALMRGTLVCGAGTVARSLKGIKAWVANATAQSGVSYTEAALNDDLQAVWEDGTEVNAIYAPMYIKRKISAFVGNTNVKNVDAGDKRLVNAVDVYIPDSASMVKLFKHRFVTVSGDTNYDIVGVNEDFWRIAYLRSPKNVPLARTGDAEKAQILGELTLECLSENAGFKRTAIL